MSFTRVKGNINCLGGNSAILVLLEISSNRFPFSAYSYGYQICIFNTVPAAHRRGTGLAKEDNCGSEREECHFRPR